MLEVKDATIAVGEKVLVRNLSFVARDGELTCITGNQGVGKTTLLRTLMGLLPVKEGFVSVDGELLSVQSAHVFRTWMAYLPQQMALLAHQLHQPEVPECEPDEYAVWNALLPSVKPEPQPGLLSPEDILELAERTIQEAAHKQIIIADEPAAMLTEELAQRLAARLRQEAARGKTVFVASRRPQIIGVANQVINLDNLRR